MCGNVKTETHSADMPVVGVARVLLVTGSYRIIFPLGFPAEESLEEFPYSSIPITDFADPGEHPNTASKAGRKPVELGCSK